MYLLLSSKQLNSASPINSEMSRAGTFAQGTSLKLCYKVEVVGCCLCTHFQNKRSQKDGAHIFLTPGTYNASRSTSG